MRRWGDKNLITTYTIISGSNEQKVTSIELKLFIILCAENE